MIKKKKTYKKKSNLKGNLKSNLKDNDKAIILLKQNEVELLLLFSILINYFILKKQHNNKILYKNKIIGLLKNLRKNNKYISIHTTDVQINNLYKSINKYFNNILISFENISQKHKRKHTHINPLLTNSLLTNPTNKITNAQLQQPQQQPQQPQPQSQNTRHNTHKLNGGFYFKSLEDKADKPITGSDITKLLDDIQKFFSNAKYVEEGAHLQDTDTLLSMLRGDVGQFKSILQYRIFPQYYATVPPFIKWDNIKKAVDTKKWEDIPDYLLAYQSYLRSRDEYDVERGLKPASILQKGLYNGFYDKVAHSLDTNIQQFQQYRNKSQGKFFPIAVPQ
jgi:hypothetical protein